MLGIRFNLLSTKQITKSARAAKAINAGTNVDLGKTITTGFGIPVLIGASMIGIGGNLQKTAQYKEYVSNQVSQKTFQTLDDSINKANTFFWNKTSAWEKVVENLGDSTSQQNKIETAKNICKKLLPANLYTHKQDSISSLRAGLGVKAMNWENAAKFAQDLAKNSAKVVR